jgi:CBS domain-containing membrane protein
MIKNALVSSIMSKDVVTLRYKDDLETAEHYFKQHKIRHIPVVENGVVKGMLSYTDLLRISFADTFGEDEMHVDSVVYNMFSIEQVMVKNVVTLPPSATVKDVAEMLATKDFHAVPIVDNNQLVGIVTSTDVIQFLLRAFE